MKRKKGNSWVGFIVACVGILTLAGRVSAGSYTWDGGGGNGSWATANNWNPNGTPTFDTTADLAFTGSVQPATYLASARTLRSLTFDANADTIFSIRLASTSGGGTARNLTLGGGVAPSITIDAGASAAHTLGVSDGSVVLAGNLTVTHNGPATFTIDRPVTGAFALTKIGPGTLTFSGGTSANTYSGLTTVSAGELNLGKTAGTDAVAGNLTVSGGTVKWLASNQLKDTAKVTLSGGKLNLQSFNETVASLCFGGAVQAAGTWGSSSSAAAHKDDAHFTAGSTGMLTVSAAPLTSYSIGNSLTLDMLGGNIGDIAAAQGFTLTAGQHIRSATSLTTIYNLPADYDSASPGPFTTALPGNRWDAVSLQSYYGGRDGIPSTRDNDLDSLQAFINLAVSNGANANTRFCLYAPWPNIDLNDSASYSNLWLMSTVNAPSEPTILCRSYFQHLYPLAKAANPGLRIIPAGELIYVLDQKMRAGLLPGFSGAANLYRDGWHLNSIGRYIVSLEAFAVMFQKDPRGVPFTYDASNPDIVPSPALLAALTNNLTAIQQTVWEVVIADSAAWDSAPVTAVYPAKDTTTTLRGNPLMNGMAYIGGETSGLWWGDPGWITNVVDVNANCNIAYIRVTWTSMEPTEGNYCWANNNEFKTMIAGLTNAGYRLAFRIMCQDAGIGGPVNGTPPYVIDAMVAGGYNPYSTVNTNYPDLLNPVWQAKYKTFILALGAAFDNPDITDFIDCDGTSIWGEGNPWLNGIPMDSRQQTYFNWHLGVYTQAFQHVMLDHYNGALAQKFSVLPRADGFGSSDPSTLSPRSNEIYAYINSYFPASPFVCEAWGGFPSTPTNANSFLSDCLNVHANVIEYKFYPDYADTRARFVANVGYRLRPKTAVFPETVSSNASMNISHVWSNDGVGSLPNMNLRWKDAVTGRGKYRVAFALFTSGSSTPAKVVVDPVPEPNLMVKGADQAYVSAIQWGVPPGGYELATALVDTTKPLAPALKLAVTNGIQRNGWTVLGAVTVAASTATPYTLTSTATEGGTVNPSGALTVSSGTNQTFTFTPNDRRKITDVKVDGVSVGTAASYIFSNVTAPHTVAVTFGVDTAPVVWTGGGAADTWIAAANWANGVTPLYYDENVVFAGTARLTPQLGSATDLGIGAARTLRSLTFADTAGSFVLGSANNVGLGLTGGLTNNSANTQTINLPLYIGNTTTTFDTPAGDVVVNAGIAGIGGLSKTGGGTLTLVGASYSGTTTVNAGTLKLTAWNTLDSRTVVRLQTGGLLNLNFNGEQTVSALFLDGVRQVSGTWGASGSGAEHASTLLSGTGVLRIISGTGAFNWNTGDGDWNTATANWSGLGTMWTDGANAANFSLANTNDLVLKVTVSATRTAGAVTIGNGCNNAYTMFSGGTLNASSFLVQGFGGNGWWAGWSTPATLNNLTLNVSGNLGVGCWSLVIGGSSAVSVAGVIGSGGIVSSPGWAMLQLQDSAAVTVAGGVNGNSDCFGLRLNGGTLTTPSIQASDRVEFGPPWDWDPARLTFNGTTVIASSNNSAFVTVGANPGSTFSAVVGNNGAIFDSNGHDIGIPVNLESNGSGGLTKLGAGTLTLSGANTYSGATAVRAGTLACSSPGALASNAVVIANGATLNLNYTGTRQIASLTFGTSLQPANTYGSASSPAPVKDARFTGTGMVTVGVRQGVFNQTITFGTLPTKTYGDTPFELTATANSGLAVTYASSDPAVARVSGSTVTILKAGSATFTASQAGDANYNAATPVAQALTVNPASQVINFGTLLAKTYGDPPFELTATANSGLAVTYVSSDPAVARVSGSTVTILKAGSVTLTASQAGDANYNAAAPVEQTLAVDKITPVITWSTPAALAAGTALDDTQLNAASGGVAGTFVYTPPAGTVLAVGAVHTLSVQFTPSDTVNYNTPAAQNVTLMVLAATPTGLAEDFERVWADNALANTTNGWTSGLEDLSTVTNPVAGYAALPGDILFPILYDHAAKKRLLRLNTQEATLATPALAAGFAQAKVYVDMMVNLCADDYLPGMDSNRLNAKTFVCLKNDGVTTNLYVFHGQKGPDGFGAPVFSAVTNLVVSGTWYRLTVVFDSTSGAGGDAEAFSVLLNGKPLFSFAAYGDGWKTRVFGDPCTPDGGSWFLSAARHSGTAATNLNRVIGVTFNGAGLIDDLVVTSHQPAFLRGTLIIIR